VINDVRTKTMRTYNFVSGSARLAPSLARAVCKTNHYGL